MLLQKLSTSGEAYHLCGFQHVLYDLVHMRCQLLRLQLQHLYQSSADCFPDPAVCIMGQAEQALDIAAQHTKLVRTPLTDTEASLAQSNTWEPSLRTWLSKTPL